MVEYAQQALTATAVVTYGSNSVGSGGGGGDNDDAGGTGW